MGFEVSEFECMERGTRSESAFTERSDPIASLAGASPPYESPSSIDHHSLALGPCAFEAWVGLERAPAPAPKTTFPGAFTCPEGPFELLHVITCNLHVIYIYMLHVNPNLGEDRLN